MCRLSVLICKYKLLLLDNFQIKWPIRPSPGNLLNPCYFNDCSVLRFSGVSCKSCHSVCPGLAILGILSTIQAICRACKFGHSSRRANWGQPSAPEEECLLSLRQPFPKFSVLVAYSLIVCLYPNQVLPSSFVALCSEIMLLSLHCGDHF